MVRTYRMAARRRGRRRRHILDSADALRIGPNGRLALRRGHRLVRAVLHPEFGRLSRAGARPLRRGDAFTAAQVQEGEPDPFNAGLNDFFRAADSVPEPADAVSCLYLLLYFAFKRIPSYIQHIFLSTAIALFLSSFSFTLSIPSFSLALSPYPPMSIVLCTFTSIFRPFTPAHTWVGARPSTILS